MNPELPDRVDAALRDFWRGSSAPLENLLPTESPEGGAIGDVLDGLTSGLDRILPHLAAGSELAGLRIVRELGRGGMGVVYAAEQSQPRRMVALKVLRPGLTSDGALRRFEYEARLLGRLRHPGIAQIYQAGSAATTEGSQPYFVMELVEGRPLAEYAERDGLSTPEKLELFCKVCEAVQHAHQNGVIHRDLKPGNILVDDSGQPRILDFGVGRAVDVETLTMHTSAGQLVGTLPYMSPEQIGGDPDELDTRSDVYSLGAVLYQLLCGRLPHDVRGLSLPEAARRIRDDEPPALSSVCGEFRGDVETIVAKALAKDRDRRYPSAVALAEDIRRHLRGEVIDAKRDSALYVFRKTLVRYRWPLIALHVFMVLLGAFAIYAMTQAQRHRDLASRERQASHAAIAAERRADEQRQQAEAQADRADAVKQFLQAMLVAADPERAQGRDVTVREVLDDAAERIQAGSLANQPAAEEEVRETIARTYHHLGLYTSAIPHYEWLNEHYTSELGEASLPTLLNLNRLATMYAAVRRHEESKAAFEHCLELAVAEHGDRHELTLMAMDGLGEVLARMGRADEAEPFHLEALAGVEEAFGREHELFVSTTFNLGSVYRAQGRLQDAEQLYLRALERSENLHGRESYITIRLRWKLARDIYRRTERLEEAETLLRETLELARRGLGNGHTETNIVLTQLSRVLEAQSKPDEAEQLLREAIAGFPEIRGIEGDDTLKVVDELSKLLRRRDEHDKAARVLREGIDRAIQVHGDEHQNLASWLNGYAGILAGTGDYAGAAAASKHVLDIRQRIFGSNHTSVASVVQAIGWFLNCAGQYEEALESYQRSLAMRRELYGETHRETLRATITLSSLMLRMGDVTAYQLLRDRYQLARTALGDTHEHTRWIAAFLSHYLSGGDRHEEAIRLDRDMLLRLMARYGEGALETGIWWDNLAVHLYHSGDSPGSVEAYQTALSIYYAHGKENSVPAVATRRGIGEALLAGGEPAGALPFARQSWEGHREVIGERAVSTVVATLTLGQALVELGRADEAEPLLREAVAVLDELPLSQAGVDYYRPRANSVLGSCLTALRRYDEAEPLLIEAYDHLQQFDLWYRFETRLARMRIVALYEAWGKPDQAAEWRARGHAAMAPAARNGMRCRMLVSFASIDIHHYLAATGAVAQPLAYRRNAPPDELQAPMASRSYSKPAGAVGSAACVSCTSPRMPSGPRPNRISQASS